MWKLVPVLVREMGQAYAELVRAEALITETLKLEETRFRATLVRGLRLLDDAVEEYGRGLYTHVQGKTVPGTERRVLPGHVAFVLHDTYGFPLDLTQDILRSRGWTVEVDGFNDEMEKQREKARAAWTGSGEAATEAVWFALREKVGATEFLGYETERAEGVVKALVKDGAEVAELNRGESGAVVLNQTPFYGESGGQVGDTGVMTGEGVRFRVTNTQKKAGDVFVHLGTVEAGALKRDAALALDVDHARRSDIRRNHSATHLLHEALRQVLGDHVAQKGSLVAPDRLRFDFSHPRPMKAEEIERVETLANDRVLENAPVVTRLMAVDEAIASGARALFGEKYGDEVRVVAMGEGGNAMGWSVELCGGTHVPRTGDIGIVSIIEEAAVGAGVRRIEALTGTYARKHANELRDVAREVAAELKVPVREVATRAGALMEERRQLELELSDTKRKLAMSGGTSASQSSNIVTVNGTQFFRLAVSGVPNNELKSLVDQARAKISSGVIAIANSAPDGKAGLVVAVSADRIPQFSAVDLARRGAEALGGKGGGKPELAQAGGPDGSKAPAALDAVEAAIRGS
jgi:alanyl-tRNA synthetase